MSTNTIEEQTSVNTVEAELAATLAKASLESTKTVPQLETASPEVSYCIHRPMLCTTIMLYFR